MTKPAYLAKYITDPDSLNRLSFSELRALWGQCCPKTRPPPHRCLLERELAFVAQSGGTKLPRETDVLVRAAMKQASVSRSPAGKGGALKGRTKMPSSRAVDDLPAGVQLKREWGGQTHEVTVLGGGWFQYKNQSYKSLSKLANEITGAHWSGPCFFGLHRFRHKS